MNTIRGSIQPGIRSSIVGGRNNVPGRNSDASFVMRNGKFYNNNSHLPRLNKFYILNIFCPIYQYLKGFNLRRELIIRMTQIAGFRLPMIFQGLWVQMEMHLTLIVVGEFNHLMTSFMQIRL